MAKAAHTKSRNNGSRKLTDDEIGDCWIAIEDAAHSDDPRMLRAALEAAQLLILHH